MTLEYDSEYDLLYVRFSGAKVSYTKGNEETGGGLTAPLRLVDYDEKDRVIGIELLDASRQLGNQADLQKFAAAFGLDLSSFVRQLAAAGLRLDRGQIAAA